MNVFIKIFFLGRNFFFPSECAVCGCALTGIEEIKYSLCRECKSSIKTNTQNKCNICGKPLISEIDTCLVCRNAGTRFYDCLHVIYPYSGKYRKLLTQYKFKKNIRLGEFFAEEILSIINNNEILKNAEIIPVPPRPGKIKDMGWDQIDYLLKCIKKLNQNINILRCLKRKKSKVQKYLKREERLKNLKDKIYLYKPAPKIALIIDDVITTGSTMEVCAEVLKKGGAERVYGLSLFYD